MDSATLTQQRKARAQFATTVATATQSLSGSPARPTSVNQLQPSDNDDVLTYLEGNVFVTQEQYSTIVVNSQYRGTSNSPLAPPAPTGLSAVAAGTSVTVSFMQGSNNGSTITNYQYSLNGGSTFVALSPAQSGSPVTISGLALNTSYSIQLKAVNAVGVGAASATLAVTTLNVASAPTITSVTGGLRRLTVAFTAPTSTGGSAITNYKYSTDGGTTYVPFVPPQTSAASYIITAGSVYGQTTLANGLTYTVLIRAVTAIGDGTPSNAVNGTTFAAPSAPTALVNTSGNQQLTIAFTPGAQGGSAITNYKYSTDGGVTFASAATSTSPVTITKLSSDGTTDLANLTFYPVVLLAVNAQGDGTPSAILNASTNNVPPAPSFTSFTPFATSIRIAFEQSGTGGTGLTISNYNYSLNGAAFVNFGTANPYTITGLASSTSYTLRLTATNALGTSAISAATTINTLSVPPAPTNLSYTPSKPVGVVTLTVYFLQNGDGGSAITDYQYSTDNGTTFRSAGTAASPVTITKLSSDGTTNLSDQTTYQVKLRALNAIGNGTASETLDARTSDVPPAPINLSYVVTGSNAISVAYQQPGDGGSTITNYLYNLNGAAFQSAGTSNNNFALSGLTPGTVNVRVEASNFYGVGAASSNLSTFIGPPGAPQTLVASKGNQQAVVNFTPGSGGNSTVGAYSYSLDGGATYTAVTPSSNRFTVSGLSNASTYSITLKATNSFGDSLPSAPVITSPTATTTLRIAAIGPGINAGIPANLSNLLVSAVNGQGYTVAPIVTPYTSSNGYTGSDLTTSNYDCAAVWTDTAQVFTGTFGSNLNAYVNSGGNLVMYGSAFGQNTTIPSFNYPTNSAFVSSFTSNVVATNSGLGTVQSIYHPTVANIPSLDLTTADIVSTIKTTSGTQGTSGAQVASSWPNASPSIGTTFVAVRDVGSAKVAGVNLYLNTTSLSYASYSNYWKFMTNALYWAGGNLT
jgi:hypothetical protein